MLESCGQSYFKWDKTRGCTAKDPATALFQSRCLPGVGKFSNRCGLFRLELRETMRIVCKLCTGAPHDQFNVKKLKFGLWRSANPSTRKDTECEHPGHFPHFQHFWWNYSRERGRRSSWHFLALLKLCGLGPVKFNAFL